MLMEWKSLSTSSETLLIPSGNGYWSHHALDQLQQNFNYHLSSTWMVVEITFGCLKSGLVVFYTMYANLPRNAWWIKEQPHQGAYQGAKAHSHQVVCKAIVSILWTVNSTGRSTVWSKTSQGSFINFFLSKLSLLVFFTEQTGSQFSQRQWFQNRLKDPVLINPYQPRSGTHPPTHIQSIPSYDIHVQGTDSFII